MAFSESQTGQGTEPTGTGAKPSVKQVHLELDGAGWGTLLVNGEDVGKICHSITITARVGQANRAEWTDLAVGAHVEIGSPLLVSLGAAHVRLRDEDHAALVALGWTPPEEA